MTDQEEKSTGLFSRIVLAAVIVGFSAMFWKIGAGVFTTDEVSMWDKLFLIGGGLLGLAGLAYVTIQRLAMRKNENFRREKW